jgi:hypothetical protein
MRACRLHRFAALVAVLSVAVVAPLSASATTPGAQQQLSDAGCKAFNDYFQVNFAVAFLTGFAEAFDDTGASDSGGSQQADIDQLQNLVFLVLSPKLEESTTVLAKQSPRSIRKLFAAQRDVYRDGVALLRDDVGLSDGQIQEIRDADFTEETPDALAEELDITKADLEAAAEEFGKQSDVLTAQDASAAQSRTFEKVAIGCGAVPDSKLDCDEIVSGDLQERLLGGSATAENADGTCSYTGEATADGEEPELAVDVYRTADAFGRLTEQNKAATEIDADNTTAEGFVTFSSFKTCGRTLFSREADLTVVVALCLPDDAELSDDDLSEVRDSVNESLG